MKFIPFSTALLSLLFLLNLSGCARPNYGDDATRGPAGEEKNSGFQTFPQSSLGMQFYWEHRPLDEKSYGTFLVEVFDPEDRSHLMDPPAPLTAQLWMPSMGHGSTPITVEKVATGVYRFSKVLFIMRGDWQIKIQIQGTNPVDEIILAERF